MEVTVIVDMVEDMVEVILMVEVTLIVEEVDVVVVVVTRWWMKRWWKVTRIHLGREIGDEVMGDIFEQSIIKMITVIKNYITL